jgi:pSer/pThr/pTyr-binding forkhead associated (FHA) protein
VQNLLVHFTHRQHPDQPLRPGVQRIVRHASGSVRLGGDAAGTLLLAQFCLDDRGLWLQVANGIRGIHVNGRPVRRMALLRPGDAVYADGVEMVIQGECEALNRPRVIGRGAEADIVIDDPAFAEQHARLERHGERLLLRDLGAGESTRVNGVIVRHCWLQPGDQLVFDAQHRFVLEVPHDGRKRVVSDEEDELLDLPTAADAPAKPKRVSRWPWLLGSALLLAAILSLLLWFGAR